MKKQWQVIPGIGLGTRVAQRLFYSEAEAIAWAQDIVRDNGSMAYVYELLATVSAAAITEKADA